MADQAPKCGFLEAHAAEDYASERGSNARLGPVDDIAPHQHGPRRLAAAPHREAGERHEGEVRAGVAGWMSHATLKGLDAYSRHKQFINQYVIAYGKEKIKQYTELSAAGKSDLEILRENHKFIRNPEEEDMSKWETRMAVKYYDKLFKEYCIADMSHYKSGRIGLRWRSQSEVFRGDGQFVCGNQSCTANGELTSYEMNFTYKEEGLRKNALVKLRLCPDCGIKLNYKKYQRDEAERKNEEKLAKKRAKKEAKHARKGKRLHIEDNGGEGDSDIASDRTDGDWVEVLSKSTGKVYWYHSETGATQWKRPRSVRGQNSPDAPQRALEDDGDENPSAYQNDDAAGTAGESVNRGGGASGAGTEVAVVKEEVEREARQIWGGKTGGLAGQQEQDGFEEYFRGMFP